MFHGFRGNSRREFYGFDIFREPRDNDTGECGDGLMILRIECVIDILDLLCYL